MARFQEKTLIVNFLFFIKKKSTKFYVEKGSFVILQKLAIIIMNKTQKDYNNLYISKIKEFFYVFLVISVE